MRTKTVGRELLEILVCPVCKKTVKQDKEELVCVGCGRRFPVVKGIPQMLPDELH